MGLDLFLVETRNYSSHSNVMGDDGASVGGCGARL
jgi:hypothetical protein